MFCKTTAAAQRTHDAGIRTAVLVGASPSMHHKVELAAKYPPQMRGDASRARHMVLWQRLWSHLGKDEYDSASNIAEGFVNVSERDEAQRLVAEGRAVFASEQMRKQNPYVRIDAPVSKRPVTRLYVSDDYTQCQKQSSSDYLAQKLNSILNQRVFNGLEAAWNEFRHMRFIDQGIVLVTLVMPGARSKSVHPQIYAGIKTLGVAQVSGVGVTLAMELYRRRATA